MHALRVHLLFVDESGRPEDKTFAVGGVVVRADEWSVVRRRWQQAHAEHCWPPDKEIKWHGTRTGEVPPALADSVFAARRGQGDASRWHEQLLPLFATHPDTKVVDGVGLVEFPARAKGEETQPSKLFTV
jgi:hypothetical protein